MVTVYVLQGAAKRYVGITEDLDRRLKEHRAGSHSGALIGDFILIHTEMFEGYASARQREKFLKSGKGREWLNQLYPRH